MTAARYFSEGVAKRVGSRDLPPELILALVTLLVQELAACRPDPVQAAAWLDAVETSRLYSLRVRWLIRLHYRGPRLHTVQAAILKELRDAAVNREGLKAMVRSAYADLKG